MTISPVARASEGAGPVMLDVAGTELTADEIEVLRHPLVGGVILFSRNFESPEQLEALTRSIHAARRPPLLITVDHEGGRVQRFRSGFTRLPPMRALGRLWDENHATALDVARATGFVLAAELRAQGVDLSFTPVLDLDFGSSTVIGDRAFHRDGEATAALAQALLVGLNEGGMGAVGKHFPGHGQVCADSHVVVPVDERDFDAIWNDDMLPYRHRLGRQLSGIMPAHVIYPKVDPNPAGFSKFWLQDVLRTRLAFRGVIFSDDLSMEGAAVAGGIVDRAEAATQAGCDAVLVCNAPDKARELLERWHPAIAADSAARVAGLARRDKAPDAFELEVRANYVLAREKVTNLAARAADQGSAA